MIKKIIFWFLLLLCLLLFLAYLHHSILDIENMQLKKASENLTKTQINNLIKNKTDITFPIILSKFIYLSVKVFITSYLLYFCSFLLNLQINLKKTLLLVIKTEYLFLLPIIYEILYFKFINQNYTLEDIQFFYPLSALNILGYKGLEAWYIYPFQVLNLFEVAYIFILAYYIGKLTQTNTDRGLTIVSASYIPALVLWVVCVMFFTLSYS